jgi:hypothetical protein
MFKDLTSNQINVNSNCYHFPIKLAKMKKDKFNIGKGMASQVSCTQL